MAADTREMIFEQIKQVLRELDICGEIADKDGYSAACTMPANHQGSHGWESHVGNIKLFCRNGNCPDKGGFITRTVEEAKKSVLTCDSCKKPMER